MNDPERLIDAGATPFERHLLHAAAHEKPPLELVSGMQAGLGLSAKTGAVTTAAGGSTVFGYVAAAVIGIGALVAGFVVWPTSAEDAPASPPATAVAPAPTPAPVEPVVAAPAAEATVAAEPEASAAPPSAASLGRKPSAAAKASVSAADELRKELLLLDEARAALKSGAPARARALLDRHARQFPNASFRQEADVLRVEALERLGERKKAASLAREFLSEHPDSPHVERVGKAAKDGAR